MKYDYSKENLEKLAKESWCECDMYQKLTGKWKTSETLRKQIKVYQIDTSHWRKTLPTINQDERILPKTELQKKIIELRNKNKSYSEIEKILNCSRSTISYALRSKTRKDIHNRMINNYSLWELKLLQKISKFLHRFSKKTNRIISKDWNMKLRGATSKFKLKMGKNQNHFGYKEVLAKYNNQTKVQCYLTGDWIDITKDDYALDHINPISRGGTCTLDNLAITTYIANQSKSNMTEDEFVELCKKVLTHHGYSITKEI